MSNYCREKQKCLQVNMEVGGFHIHRLNAEDCHIQARITERFRKHNTKISHGLLFLLIRNVYL